MKYYSPQTVAEALELLAVYKGQARLIAGGTDLLLDLKSGKYHIEALIDTAKIHELCQIEQEGDCLVIGGGTTHTQICKNDLIRRYAASLAEGCHAVGSLQIRNVATLAGNLVNAQPAADGAMGLAVLDPEIVVLSQRVERRLKMDQIYAGFGKSAIDNTQEIITQIRLPISKDNVASAFIRLELRKALALPMLNAAAAVGIKNDYVRWAKIAMGPVGVGPTRACEAEKFLEGKQFTEENIHKASQLALAQANPRSNPLRGSREYRMETLPAVVMDCLYAVQSRLEH
ncbi:MAG: FAD binding domain-containing protein [Christensenellaceae bacterium]|jgi:carbon-monoxide dehydrogenase medium subunit|nr:FAD binding domain-containing protein [Christensenellaceae bacterium]